ncbi:MAG: 30S ribosomal protein S20 [Alphaproteobacteria bacterium]|nr:30S ribosomal protein S20 [Alphaproteobacteria bacterium]
MANLKSAKTRVRRNKNRADINLKRLNAARTDVKKTRAAIAAGDKKAAGEACRTAETALAKAAGRGTLHKKTASRLIARLVAAIKKMG